MCGKINKLSNLSLHQFWQYSFVKQFWKKASRLNKPKKQKTNSLYPMLTHTSCVHLRLLSWYYETRISRHCPTHRQVLPLFLNAYNTRSYELHLRKQTHIYVYTYRERHLQ